ncbi:MAG: hypothetical protein ACE366_18925 [Bradymonadia bacterium]
MKFGQMTVWLLISLFAVSGTAYAKKSKNQAEAHRLEEEISKLARKNHWGGVERNYKQLMKLKKVTIKAQTHVTGAQSAKENADVAEWIERLKRAGAQGRDELGYVKKSFGQVKIKKQKGNALTPDGGMPFDPVHRKLVEAAASQVKKKGKFKGWLPVGGYTVGQKAFTVRAGQTTKVKK